MSELIDALTISPKSWWRKARSDSVVDRLNYPGDIPKGNYLLTPYGVISMETSFHDAEIVAHLESIVGQYVMPLNQFFEEYNLTLLEGRIPVITFGSNWIPDQLRKKMEDFIPAKQGELDVNGWQYHDFVVPVTSAKLEDHLAVWSLYSAQGAYAFAALKPEKDAQITVGVNWVTPEQLEALNESEPNYNVGVFTIEVDGKKLQALGYVAKSQAGFYNSNDGAIPLERLLPEDSGLEGMTQSEFMDRVNEETGLYDKLSKITSTNIQSAQRVSKWVYESMKTSATHTYIGENEQVYDVDAAEVIKAIARDSGRVGYIDPNSYPEGITAPQIIPKDRMDLAEPYLLANQLS